MSLRRLSASHTAIDETPPAPVDSVRYRLGQIDTVHLAEIHGGPTVRYTEGWRPDFRKASFVLFSTIVVMRYFPEAGSREVFQSVDDAARHVSEATQTG